jgi:hypothetical protein
MPRTPLMAGDCIAVVSHILNAPVCAVFDRLRREAPGTYDVRMILSSDDPLAPLAGLAESDVERISLDQILALPYPQKCQLKDWEMAGNLDLVFLEFYRRYPDYDRYWFVEYDVFWQGNWSVFFDYFHSSTTDLLAASIHPVDDVPHKAEFPYPRQIVPEGMTWNRADVIKAFLPICRISRQALVALDRAYRAGLGGHYEINVPSVAAQNGLALEDFGGNGRFVKPDNINRFYFARPSSFTHSPGNFVFRPPQRVLPRQNTLWHPVKPDGVPAWHPLLVKGSALRTVSERLKLHLNRVITWLWFATRWRPLP